MYTFAVDWDGTLVENAWPLMGEWLPGAVHALKALDALGKVVIHSCRVAPWEFDSEGQWRIWRDPKDTANSIAEVQEMLAAVGLGHIEIWTRDFKPPALVYIDDRAVRFTQFENGSNNWVEILEFINGLTKSDISVTMGGNVPLSKTEQKQLDRSKRKAVGS